MSPSAFERIHNINPALNRVLSRPLYVLSYLVLCVLLVSPYLVRVGVALFINVFFNRPRVYLNYLARLVARPMNFATTTVFYFVFVGLYALLWRVAAAREPQFGAAEDTWVSTPETESTDARTMYYQS